MAEKIKLVKNDTGPQLRLTLTDQNTGDVMDLTGATVTMHFRAANTTEVLFSRAGYVNPATAETGQTIITFEEGDFARDPGDYEGEVEVVFGDGMRQTVFDLLKFKMRGDFA